MLEFAPPENTGGSPITGYLLQVLVNSDIDPSVTGEVWKSVPLDESNENEDDSQWTYAGLTQRVTAIPTNSIHKRIPLVHSRAYRFRVAAKE